METTKHGWNVLDGDAGLVWREYHFNKGSVATTLVFRGADDNLVVVSPSSRTDPAALDELGDYGQVSALVACNGFHHLGLPEWQKRFPKAKLFAPASAIPRLEKKSASRGFAPLEDATSLVGPRATLTDAPGLGWGNAFVTVPSARGPVWYASDFLANISSMPTNFFVRALFSATDSAPGFKLFRPAVWLMTKDKKAFRAWAEVEIDRTKPAVVVPAHGAPYAGEDAARAAKAQIARI